MLHIIIICFLFSPHLCTIKRKIHASLFVHQLSLAPICFWTTSKNWCNRTLKFIGIFLWVVLSDLTAVLLFLIMDFLCSHSTVTESCSAYALRGGIDRYSRGTPLYIIIWAYCFHCNITLIFLFIVSSIVFRHITYHSSYCRIASEHSPLHWTWEGQFHM